MPLCHIKKVLRGDIEAFQFQLCNSLWVHISSELLFSFALSSFLPHVRLMPCQVTEFFPQIGGKGEKKQTLFMIGLITSALNMYVNHIICLWERFTYNKYTPMWSHFFPMLSPTSVRLLRGRPGSATLNYTRPALFFIVLHNRSVLCKDLMVSLKYTFLCGGKK